MKRQWIAIACVTAGISLSVMAAAAQGPQGVGAGEAARSQSPSHNPLNWLRKNKSTATESLDADKNQSEKLTARMRAQGMLPASADLKKTCSNFKDLGECLAALHAGHSLDVDFNCLKSMITGVQTNVYMSWCASATDGKPMSLSKAIHVSKPAADAGSEAKKAEEQARDDLAEAQS
jgi:hypothetical protein